VSPATQPGLHLLAEADREHLRRLVTEHGLAATARLLGVSRGVVSSAVAEIGVRRGSYELLRDALARQAGSAT